MNKILALTIATLVSITGLAQTTADTISVRKTIIAFQDDFNDGSFNNTANYATDDWVHIAPNGGIGRGREALAKELRSIHQSFLKGVTMTLENINIRFITPDVALVDVIHKVSTYVTPDGVKHENERQMKSYAVVMQNGKWLMSLDHNTIIQ